jgi:hypothetical protein
MEWNCKFLFFLIRFSLCLQFWIVSRFMSMYIYNKRGRVSVRFTGSPGFRVDRVSPDQLPDRFLLRPGLVPDPGWPGPGSTRRAGPDFKTMYEWTQIRLNIISKSSWIEMDYFQGWDWMVFREEIFGFYQIKGKESWCVLPLFTYK